MKHITLPRPLVLFFIFLSVRSFGQTPQGCNTAAIRAAFAATGHYTELVVNGQPCSLYFVNTTSGDAAQAETDAETLGAHTAVMNDATENANVSAAINAAGWLNGGAVIWIGYHRTGTGDSYPFAPLDGTPLGYTNWNPGEPNDNGWGGGNNSPGCYTSLTGCTFCSDAYRCNNGEQCVEMYASGTWNDYPCNSTSLALVEVNLCPLISGPGDTLLCTAGATLNYTTTTVLGSVPYSYSWSPGGQNTSSITVTPSVTTLYSVTVTDRYSCYSSKSMTATVVGLTTPVVTASSTSVCTGQNTYLNYTGTYSGTAVLTWGFSGGINTPGTPPDSISWATSGTKNVTLFVTDQGCTSNTGTLPVTVNAIPVANAGPAVQVCSGAQVTLGTAPVGGVSYSWSPALGLSNPAIANPVFSAVNPGTTTLNYPFVVTASQNGCSSSSSAVVTLYPPVSNAFTVNPSTVCTGQNAVITYTGTNSAAATYSWNFGGATVVSGNAQGPYSVNWSTAGSPSVSLSVNENNCTATGVSNVVTVNAIPVADAGPDVQFCSGSSANLGSAAVAGVTYSWSPIVGLSSASVSNPVVGGINPTSSTIAQYYTVTASANGCSSADSALVTLYAPIVTTFSIAPPSACINQNVAITYTGTNSAGATYNWNFGGGTVVSGAGQGPYSVNWATAGNPNLSLNVTENGCTGAATTVAMSVGNPPVANAGANQTVCSGGKVQLGTAGVGADTYTWSPASDLSNANIAQPSFSYSNTATTAQSFTYTLTADDNGCTASASVNVSVSPPVAVPVIASGPLEFCDGNSVTLSFSSTYTAYQWTNAGTSPQITVTTSGNYGAALVDASGCEFVGLPVTVVVDPNPSVNLVNKTDEQCYGEADAALTVAGAGGNQPYTYSWNTTPAQTTANATSLLAGPYTVTVTDQKNCTVTGQYQIDTATFFGVTIDSAHMVSCYGFSDGEIFATAKGGATAYTYLWSNGAGAAVNRNLVAGSYAITVTDAHGCTVTDSTIITQPDSFSVVIGDSLTMDFGSHLAVPITVTPSGSYTYVWTPSNSLSCADCPNPVSLASLTTVYKVKVTNSIGCSNYVTFTVNVNGDKHLFVPNAFTPGGNANNLFKIYTIGEQYIRFMIFNRWGEKVFEGNTLDEGWDGQFKGKAEPAGVYTYELTVVYLDGQNLKRSGTLTLLR